MARGQGGAAEAGDAGGEGRGDTHVQDLPDGVVLHLDAREEGDGAGAEDDGAENLDGGGAEARDEGAREEGREVHRDHVGLRGGGGGGAVK